MQIILPYPLALGTELWADGLKCGFYQEQKQTAPTSLVSAARSLTRRGPSFSQSTSL